MEPVARRTRRRCEEDLINRWRSLKKAKTYSSSGGSEKKDEVSSNEDFETVISPDFCGAKDEEDENGEISSQGEDDEEGRENGESSSQGEDDEEGMENGESTNGGVGEEKKTGKRGKSRGLTADENSDEPIKLHFTEEDEDSSSSDVESGEETDSEKSEQETDSLYKMLDLCQACGDDNDSANLDDEDHSLGLGTAENHEQLCKGDMI